MQGYTLSERGKELIKWYYNRILATKIISILIGIVVALGLFWVLDDTMWYPLEFLIIWFCCFLGIFGSRTALVQLLQCNYTDLLNNKGEPRLFLEVFHGLKRLSHNKQMKPVDMLNAHARAAPSYSILTDISRNWAGTPVQKKLSEVRR